ncbi:hypothetical protein A0H81_10186 [Grifola frondosa]|uniref:Uncharacterized protein n=1 Tax=Grifola frondosa TaxID=5627 RepID=A0A1C7LZ14_GRIFR|nr:hypothetical protein A0H81_10186 [Grifola frondosa]
MYLWFRGHRGNKCCPLVNAQSILPSAFYMCCLLGPAVIDGHQREDGTVEYLSTDDLRRCLHARTKLVEANVAIAFRMFAGHVSIGCKDIKTCERALRESRRALRTSYRAVASYHVLQSWKHWIADQDAEVEFCDRCETMLFARDVEERRNIWKTLPSIMGLHNWKAIMDESGVD